MILKGRGRLLRIGKKEIADGHPVDEYNNEVLCRLTPLQQKEVGIPAFYIRPVVPRLKSSDENEACLSEMAHLEDELYKAEEEAGIPHQKQNFVVRVLSLSGGPGHIPGGSARMRCGTPYRSLHNL